MKEKMAWLIFILLIFVIIQQCSIMIVSKPNGPVNIDHQQKPEVDAKLRERNRVEENNASYDTIHEIGLY